jgi:carbon monoxide dehydrogenase subunit G
MIGIGTRYPRGEEIPMEFDNSFTVQKPIDEVWNTMTDLERVVPCVPDARVIEKTGDRAVRARRDHRTG